MAGESAYDKARQARERSERLARQAANWEKGAAGESETAAALHLLGPEWTHWHDLKWPGRRYANIDHIAIGPGGIFVIDSKNWSGSITVTDGILRQNGYRREKSVASCADSSLAVGELLPRYLDRVRPVMCFATDAEISGWARDVMLCSTSNIATMLMTRPEVLQVDEVVDAVLTLQARLRSMAPPSAPVSTPRPRVRAPHSRNCRGSTSKQTHRRRPASRLHRVRDSALGDVREGDPHGARGHRAAR